MKGLGVLIFAIAVALFVNIALGGNSSYDFGRVWAWAITAVTFAALLAYVGNAFKQRLDGIFIDDRNRISLARFQLVLWTVLLVSALMTAGLSNAALGDVTPLAIKVPPEVWALLGIGAFSFVTAPVLVESRKKDKKPTAALVERVEATVKAEDALTKTVKLDNNVPSKEEAPEARWMDIVRGDTTAGYAQIDVSKVQQLAFTILLVSIYAGALSDKMIVDSKLPFIKDFPTIDQGFVALLGLSHAAYLAYKKTAN
ncbi:hypothetical protein NKI15_22270 [Mesorhizobium sp. M0862]|uniref:hypothetical protein n=1 Tax=Mesorhizobium sp. M0862 TaxID=2957015 RepID=UPI003339CF75